MQLLYRGTFKVIHTLLRFGGLAAPITRLSKIWLRHSQTMQIVRSARIDAVIDGGAYVGEFASLMRTALPDADLVCVEPQTECVALLKAKGYRVVHAALWKENTRLTLSQPSDDGTSCTVVSGAASVKPTQQVDAVRLDSIPITGNRLFVKLDLQGAEPEALEGMGALWERCAMVQLEADLAPGGNYPALRALLAERNFVEYAIVNQLFVDNLVTEADVIWLRRDIWSDLWTGKAHTSGQP